MTDERRRNLEREATTDPGAATALIVARLRRAPFCDKCEGTGKLGEFTSFGGETEPAWTGLTCAGCAGTGVPFRALVELAAYCHDKSARAALAPMRIADDSRELPGIGVQHNVLYVPVDLVQWTRGLTRWAGLGQTTTWLASRAAVAAAKPALEVWEERSEDGGTEYVTCQSCSGQGEHLMLDDEDEEGLTCSRCHGSGAHPSPRPGLAIKAAEAWLACPCERHHRRWGAAWRAANGQTTWLPYDDDALHHRVGACGELGGVARVREAIGASLIPWALRTEAA